MSTKTLTAQNKRTTVSSLNQLIDVVGQDVSSSNSSSTRKKYQVFVTGGVGPGVTSSLFQTVYDQDFSLQTANPMFDMTVGLFSGSNTVSVATTGEDSNGKLLFTSTSVMMREKINIYRQYAQLLLGNADGQFAAPFGDSLVDSKINEAMFLSFKRLFSRDGIKRETFALKFFQTGTLSNHSPDEGYLQPKRTTLNITSQTGSAVFTDVGSSTNLQKTEMGGDVGNIVDSSNTSRTVGNIFYKEGIVVFDLSKIISGSQHVSGVIGGMRSGIAHGIQDGKVGIGTEAEQKDATYIPSLLVSASIDDIVDHLSSCRFGSDSSVIATFQNETLINSTLFFCRAGPDEFNYSSNPTYTDSTGRINVIDLNQETTQKPFTFVTTVALHNARDEVMAVAKLSRPVEKNDEKDITFRVRLDF
jgi:hypothetical protein